MEIKSNRIPAKPRSKYHKYVTGGSSVNGSTSNNVASITNYVRLTGETEQIIEGTVGSTANIVAY